MAYISVVAPCFNEETCIHEFYTRTQAALHNSGVASYEILFVDDGSVDGTWEAIVYLSERDPQVSGVKFLRNFGHQAAVTAGLTLSCGDRILLIDSDLQDPPELLGEMIHLMNQGADVVYGQRRSRESETWFKRASAAAFYRTLERLTAIKVPRDTGDFRLMTRQVVDVVLTMQERTRFIRGMVSWVGGKQVPILYDRQPRFAGTTGYSFRKMVRFGLDAVTSFSPIPLRLATYAGFLSAIMALILLGFTVFQWCIHDTVVGWSSIMAAITFFGSVNLICLGVFGEYLNVMFNEIKGRPIYVVGAVTKPRSMAEHSHVHRDMSMK